MLAHLPGLVAITCPSVNSYRRLQPQTWSSAFAVYGHDNREAALRIASPFWSDVAGTINLELKAPNSSAIPTSRWALCWPPVSTGSIAGLDPGPPIEIDPATLTDQQRKERGIVRLPASLTEALDALQADTLLLDALGPLLARSFLVVRRSEAEAFRGQDSDFEIANHFHKY